MTEEQLENFLARIDQVKIDQAPRFGQMNAHQMICHCTDQFRLTFGEKYGEKVTTLEPDEMVALARAGKFVPTPKGMGQVEGEGTQPTTFEEDKETLKSYLLKFISLKEGFEYSLHPYFGEMDRTAWDRLVIYHLNHHLGQFGG